MVLIHRETTETTETTWDLFVCYTNRSISDRSPGIFLTGQVLLLCAAVLNGAQYYSYSTEKKVDKAFKAALQAEIAAFKTSAD